MVFADEIAGMEKSKFVILIILLLSFILLIFFLYLGCTFVDSNYNKIVERRGKYKKTLLPGFRFYIPILDKVVGKVNMSNTIFKNSLPICVPTKLDGTLDIRYSVVYSVFDAKTYFYASNNFENLFGATLSSFILEFCVKNNIDSISSLYKNDFEQKIKQLDFSSYGILVHSFSFVGIKLAKWKFF